MSESAEIAESSARVEVCETLAKQLDAMSELFELLDIDGWARHFARDAELLRMRAREFEALEHAEGT